MSKFVLEFSTDNDAFQTGPYALYSVLQEVANRSGQGETEGSIRDLNGNTVGSFRHEQDDLETYREIPTLDEED